MYSGHMKCRFLFMYLKLSIVGWLLWMPRECFVNCKYRMLKPGEFVLGELTVYSGR